MARPKLPSIEEILEDPSIVLSLPIPLIHEVKERLLHIDQALGGAANVQATPIEMAIAHPRHAWMDTRHLHYLGEKVADTIEGTGATIVCQPPRTAKSTTCSMWTPFWALARDPETHILFISYEANFARGWGTKVRRLVEMYGEEYNLRLNPKKTAGDDWELVTGGGMITAGVGGGISGKPAKLLIFDDVLKNKEEASSQTIRENTWDWFESTVVQRIEPDTAVFGIGTRYHEDDILGRLIKASNDGSGMAFSVSSMAALALEDDPVGREPGEGLWPEKFPQSFWEHRRDTITPYTWWSVYQQKPSPPGGNMVDPEWWRFYKPSEMPVEFDQEIQSWDLALDAIKKSDSYHAGLVLSRKGSMIFVRDSFHRHCSINEVITAIRQWKSIYEKARTKLIERAISGPALVATLNAEIGGMLAWPPKGRRKGSKEACLDACIPDIRAGNVLLPLNPDGTRPKWVQEFIEELRQFPRAPNDDWVDAFSQGLGFLLPSVRASLERDKREERYRKPIETPEQAHNASLHAVLKKLAAPKLTAMKAIARRQERALFPLSTGIPTHAGVARSRGRGRGLW